MKLFTILLAVTILFGCSLVPDNQERLKQRNQAQDDDVYHYSICIEIDKGELPR